MTTLIVKNHKLYGDRRKVVNYYRQGMVGIQEEKKIYKLPFCMYGTCGFDLEPGSVLEVSVRQRLAILFALDYFFSRAFKRNYPQLHQSLEKTRFFKQLIILRKPVKENLNNDLVSAGTGLVAVNARTVISLGISSNYRGDILSGKETIVVGSGSKMASILLEHGLPISEIYHAVRASGTPSGAVYDVLDTAELDTALFPPVCDPAFLAAFTAQLSEYLAGDSQVTKEEHATYTDDCVSLLSVLGTMGKLNKKSNVMRFNDKALANNFKDCYDKDSRDYKFRLMVFEFTTEERIKK